MKGKISQWNDDKGFGFISIPEKKDRIFFHISSIQTRERRPEVGDSVDFELGKDKNGKIRAASVLINGLSVTTQSNRQKFIKVEPPKKNALDHLLSVILLGSLGFAGFTFYTSQNIEKSWPYAVPAVIAFVLLGRSKKPKQAHYSCAKCKAVERFNQRTIEAWNSGITRLFCNKCHHEWIKNNPREEKSYSPASSSSGCLGAFLVLSVMPILGGLAIYQWFA